MDIERLLSVLNDCLTDEQENNFQTLITQMQQFLAQNNVPGVDQMKKEIFEKAEYSKMNDYSLSNQKILKHLKTDLYFSEWLILSLNTILHSEIHQVNPEFQKYVNERAQKISKLKSIKQQIEELWFQPHFFSEAEKYEIGITFPTDINDLGDISKILVDWDMFLSDLWRINGDTERNKNSISMVNRWCLEFFVVWWLILAKQLGGILNIFADFLIKINSIEKIRLEIEEKKLSNASMKKWMEEQKKEALLTFKKDILAQLPANTEAEERVRISHMSEKMIKLVCKWVQIEIISPQYEETDVAEEGEEAGTNDPAKTKRIEEQKKISQELWSVGQKAKQVFWEIQNKTLSLPESILTEMCQEEEKITDNEKGEATVQKVSPVKKTK